MAAPVEKTIKILKNFSIMGSPLRVGRRITMSKNTNI